MPEEPFRNERDGASPRRDGSPSVVGAEWRARRAGAPSIDMAGRRHSPFTINVDASVRAGGSVPCIAGLAAKLVNDETLAAPHREQYRRLAASLHQLHPEGLSVVMITSAVPGEGKTITAANLALTFSQSYQREVLLVDADLRRPGLHVVFGVDNNGGLSEFLAASREAEVPARAVAPRLSLLPAGEPTSDPMARLTSARMKRLFAQAPDLFDWVIVDAPAMAPTPDAGLLASMVDGVLMVVRARSTRYEAVKRAIDAVGRDRIVGVVLNHADAAALESHSGKYDVYFPDQAGR